MEIFVIVGIWFACGFLAGAVAESKGRGAGGWFLAGLIFGPLGLLAAVGVAKTDKPKLGEVRCRACRSTIDAEATICPHCRTTDPVSSEERERAASEVRGRTIARTAIWLVVSVLVIWAFSRCPR